MSDGISPESAYLVVEAPTAATNRSSPSAPRYIWNAVIEALEGCDQVTTTCVFVRSCGRLPSVTYVAAFVSPPEADIAVTFHVCMLVPLTPEKLVASSPVGGLTVAKTTIDCPL